MPYSQFHKFINQRTIVSNETMEAIREKSIIKTVKKGHYLLKEGMVCNQIWFIAEGSVRTMYLYKDKEVTSWIYNNNQMVTAYGSFFTRNPAHENIQCTEDCTLISLTHENLNWLYENHPKMAKFGRIYLEEIVGILDIFFKGFMFMTAKEKYDVMLTFFPDITQRVNLGYIASFLGITQETLSRIRRK